MKFQHLTANPRLLAVVYLILAFQFIFVATSFSETDYSSEFSPEELRRPSSFRKGADDLTPLQHQARMYRAQGLESQSAGNLDSAMALYQKAIELDPMFPDAYNDLGIIYEAKGYNDRAEEVYVKAIKLDPAYLSAYSNLALLYENQRNLDKAAYYWQKRGELGLADDPWTIKAKQRLEDIQLSMSDRPLQEIKEREVIGLANSVSIEKFILKKDNAELGKYYYRDAKQKYERGEEVAALKKATDASQLDPTNDDIKEFEEKVQTRLLSK